MIKKCISKNWKFTEYFGYDEFVYGYSTTQYQTVDLPHDYLISKKREDMPGGSCTGYYPVIRSKYVKYLNFEQNKHYVLDLDGAYMCAHIFMNEGHLALHPYGYTPFLVDLTGYIAPNVTNKLAITVNPLPDTSRWYTGCGIYRDVFLWEGGYIRIEPRDMFVSTIEATEQHAALRLKYKVSTDSDANAVIRFCVKDTVGQVVASDETSLSVPKLGIEQEHILHVENPQLWDLDHPNLHTLTTEIVVDGQVIDTTETTFGIRTVVPDVDKGLLLNGKPVKLKGGCIHHDNGVLGAAAFPAAEERKIRLLKEAGFNAIRAAHNPVSLAMLEACDRLGMAVMEEAFDCWNKPKLNVNDYNLFFSDWCIRDVAYMVLRDRNHPCVFSYSIGNEIREVDGLSDAGKWSAALCGEIKKYDDTRFTTAGIQRLCAIVHPEDSDPEDYKAYIDGKHGHKTINEIAQACSAFEEPLDVPGFNYYYENYVNERNRNSKKPMWGSETLTLPLYDQWQAVMDNDYVMGDFVWTAIDNIGEVGHGRGYWVSKEEFDKLPPRYPWRTCYQGDLDLCGFRLPKSYFREAVWYPDRAPRIFVTKPEHYGKPYTCTDWGWQDVYEVWTFDEKYVGQKVKVETYTDADEIVWFINGREIGRSIPEKAIASLETVYEKGELTAVSYKNGTEANRYSLYTTNSASRIVVTPEIKEFLADNRDLCYFDISITDDAGRLIADAQSEVFCEVAGGELLGIYSGDPCNEDQFTSNVCHTYRGRALAVVRATTPGEVTLTVSSDKLMSDTGIAQAR